MKTVLHLIDSMGRGGAERVILNTLKFNNGFNNILVLLKDVNIFKQEIKDEVIVLNYNKKEKKAKKEAAKRLRDIINEKKVDIVHAHLPLSTLIARLGTPPTVKLVFTVHNNYKYKFLRSPILYFREKKYYRSNQIGVFVSDDARKFYNKSIGLKGKSIVLHNFIDDSCYKEAKYKFVEKREPLMMIATGNLRHQKQHEFLIRALKNVDKSKYILNIYGGGKLKKRLESLIKKYGMEKNVFLNGSIPNKQLLQIMVEQDLFVMPSLYEGFSLALSEAVILGMPCLLSDIGSSKENAEDAAIYFRQGDKGSFISKLEEVINDRKLLLKTHKKTIERSKTYLTSKEYVSELNKIYN